MSVRLSPFPLVTRRRRPARLPLGRRFEYWQILDARRQYAAAVPAVEYWGEAAAEIPF